MANKKVWHGGSNTAPYETWATAATSIATAAAAAGLNEAVEVADDHTGDASGTTALTIPFAGTSEAPTLCYTVDRATGLKSNTQVLIKRTGSSGIISISGSVWASTFSIEVGVGTNATALTLAASSSPDEVQIYKDVAFRLLGSGSTNRINLGNANTTSRKSVQWIDCTLRGTTTSGTGLLRSSGGVAFEWNGGGVEAGSSAFPYLFDVSNIRPMPIRAANLDLTAVSDTLQLVSPAAGNSSTVRGRLENIAMPATWVGAVADAGNPGAEIIAVNVGGGNNNYQFAHVGYVGRTVQDTGIYRSGGATDGTTPVSWKITSTADAKWPALPYVGAPVAVWVDSSGSSVTVTFEVLTDGVTLTDQDFGLEYSYLGSSTTSLGTVARTTPADILASAANLTTSSETWVSTGLASPVKQKLSFTFTPQKKGFVQAVPILHRASTTVYFDPEPTVT